VLAGLSELSITELPALKDHKIMKLKIALALALTACSSPTPVITDSRCVPLTKVELRTIERGLEEDSEAVMGDTAVRVLLLGDQGFKQVAAVELFTGVNEVATFAADDLSDSGGGWIVGINDTALNHFMWGSGLAPGAWMDNTLVSIMESHDYAEAVDCVVREAQPRSLHRQSRRAGPWR
jgi:hypothetical protein